MTRFDQIVIMLHRESCLMCDNLGLLWGVNRIREAKATLMLGPEAQLWTSTRLVLGLSSNEAKSAGKQLRHKRLLEENK